MKYGSGLFTFTSSSWWIEKFLMPKRKKNIFFFDKSLILWFIIDVIDYKYLSAFRVLLGLNLGNYLFIVTEFFPVRNFFKSENRKKLLGTRSREYDWCKFNSKQLHHYFYRFKKLFRLWAGRPSTFRRALAYLNIS